MKLFNEFKTSNIEDWQKLAQGIVKSEDLKALNWSHDPDIILPPYFDASTLPHSKSHHTGMLKLKRGWLTLELLALDHTTSANAVNALNMGAEGVLIEAEGSTFDRNLVSSILPEHCWVGLRLQECNEQELEQLVDWLKYSGADSANYVGLVCNKVEEITLLSKFTDAINISDIKNRVEKLRTFGNFRTIEIRVDVFMMAGATISQQLAYLLAYTRYLVDELHISIADFISNCVFTMAVDRDFYHEIAKLRSARLLIFKLFAAYGHTVKLDDIFIIGVTTPTSDSWLDPNTNYLRKTTQSLSAIIGGVNALIVTPFETNGYNPFTRRISRNISNLLRDEVYLDKVADPLAGSYFIESLTEKLSQEAWQKFNKIESSGGFVSYVDSGKLKNELKANQKLQAEAMAKRKLRMVGVNDYPNTVQGAEVPPTTDQNDEWRFRPAASIEHFVREFSEFEKKLVVNPITIGDNEPMKSARVNFAINFIGSAGFEVNAARQYPNFEKSDIVILCGSDEDFEALEKAIITDLKVSCRLLLLAGFPTNTAQLTTWGIDLLIHRKSDMNETFQYILDELRKK